MKTRIINLFEENGLVDDSNREIITFGLTKMISTALMLMFTIILSVLMGDFLVGILFEASFIMLRRYAGGYHAETKERCLVLTYFSTLVFITLIYVVPMNKSIFILMMFLFLRVVYKYSPKESENKPLNITEKKIYRRKSIYIAIIEIVVFIVFIHSGMYIYAKSVFFAFFMVIIGMICMPNKIE